MTRPPYWHAWLSNEPMGGIPRAVSAVGIALFAILVWWTFYDASFQGLTYPDANDYAQMGRQLSRGAGMSSKQNFPYILAWSHEENLSAEPPWPNLYRFPLPIVLHAIAFRAIGPTDFAAVLPCAVFFVGTAVMVFLIGNRLYGPLAGLLAAVLASTSDAQIHYALSGLTESATAFFLCAIAAALLAVADRPKRIAPLIFLGGLIGLAFLERYNFAFVAVVAGSLVWIGPTRQGFRAAAWVAVAAFLVALPWFWINFSEYGSPLVYLTSDRNLLKGIVPGDVFFHIAQYDPWAKLLEDPSLPIGKMTSLAPLQNWQVLFGREFVWLGPVFLSSVVAQQTRERFTVWLFLAATLALMVLAYSATVSVPRFYRPFAPLLLVVVCGAASVFFLKLPRRARMAAPVFAIVLAAYLIRPVVTAIPQHATQPASMERICGAIDRLTESDAVIASPTSYKVAWSCDRPAVRFYSQWEELEEIHRRIVRIDGVFFESRRAKNLARSGERGGGAGAFPVRYRLPQEAELWLRAPGGNGG